MPSARFRSRRLAAGAVAAATALLLGGALTAAAAAPASIGARLAPVPKTALHHFDAPPTYAECQGMGLTCYTPKQLQKAYDMGPLYAHGKTGAGVKILIVDSFGSPTIQHDLDVYSDTFGLPRTKVTIIQPSGRVPAFDPANDDMVGWAEETTLDVELAHAMAPGAQLVLAETPVSEAEGLTGLPEMMHAEQWAMRHGLADVISQSFGAGENTFDHPKRDIESVRFAFKEAARRHVTVLAASGDAGPEDYDKAGDALVPYRQASWPASDPLVTSVGGTQIFLDSAGERTQPDAVWNESDLFQDAVAGGGDRSAVFTRPAYQDGVRNVVHGSRGYPDLSMSAAVFESPILYWTIPGLDPGYILGIGGTSAATPLLAGFVAVADQVAGHRLGLLNPALYRLSAEPASRSGIVDVTTGNNTVPDVLGFDATPGYDLASGLGTVDGTKLALALAGTHPYR